MLNKHIPIIQNPTLFSGWMKSMDVLCTRKNVTMTIIPFLTLLHKSVPIITNISGEPMAAIYSFRFEEVNFIC